jgi:hypothetical protein
MGLGICRLWVNEKIEAEEEAWKAEGNRHLLLLNKTVKHGNFFENVNVGFYRKGNYSFIFINNPYPKIIKPNQQLIIRRYYHFDPYDEWKTKTFGIWLSKNGYKLVVPSHECFTGNGGKGHMDFPKFGIYTVGAVIRENANNYILTRDAGWKRKEHPNDFKIFS